MELKRAYFAAGICAPIIAAVAYFWPSVTPSTRQTVASNGGALVIGGAVSGGSITLNNAPASNTSPRAKLQQEGVSWSEDNFRAAIREGNKEDVLLFLQAGMKINDPVDENTGLFMALDEVFVHNGAYDDFAWLMDDFKQFGLDLNQPVKGLWGELKLPLVWLAEQNSKFCDNRAAAQVLIMHGANVGLAIADIRQRGYVSGPSNPSADAAIAFLKSL